MSSGKFVGEAVVTAALKLNPFGREGYERRARNKAYRKARRKKRRGEVLTPEEMIIMAGEVVEMKLPDGTVVERTEPIWKKRTSTKVGTVVGVPFVAGLVTLIPYYDQANDVLLRACQSEQGPAVALAGFGIAGVLAYVTARFTRSPAVPGPL